MLEGIHFSYDNIKSVDMGLINCQINGNMFEESFVPSRSINEIQIAGRDKPYFIDVTYEPMEFELTFAFENGYDERKIREVARWLNQGYYKPFYTVDNPNRIFYCMLVDDSSLVHNGMKQGYIKVKFRCDGAFAYQPITIKEDMQFTNTKLVKNYTANTFNSGTILSNMNLVGGKLVLDVTPKTWNDYLGKRWIDIV